MQIRNPRPDEHDRITDQLLWPAFEESTENDPAFSALADDAREEAGGPTYWTSDDDRVLFIAVRAETLLGSVSGGISPSPPPYARGDTAYCDGLYVRRAHRREGVATALFERFEKWGREQDCEYLGVSVHVDREPARSFYEALDFKAKFLSLRRPL
jgi:GNAT superfamily N-acetyltransferase